MAGNTGIRRTLAGLLLGLVTAGVVILADALFGLTASNPLEIAELKTYDWRLAATADPRTARTDIALIEIDEYSLRNLERNAGRWPWPRAFHSFLLNYLARTTPKVIGYDVNFAEVDTRSSFTFGGVTYTGPESDRALANAVASSGNVVVLVDAVFDGESVNELPRLPDTGVRLDSPFVLDRQLVLPPYRALAEAATVVGHNYLVLDADGPLRHTVPFVRAGSQAIPSLGLAAALRAEGVPGESIRIQDDRLHLGERVMPLSRRRVLSASGEQEYYWAPINFRGPALLEDLKSRPYPSYRFYDLLYSEQQILAGQKPDIDPSVFKDKIVFVGATGSGLKDVFETPFSGGAMPGIQVHAAVADDMLSGRFLRPAGKWANLAAIAIPAAAIGVAAAALPTWWAMLIAGGTIAFLFGLTMTLFARGYWLNLAQPALGAALAVFAGVAYQYVVEGRERRKMRKLFGQYVSRDVCEQLIANPDLARLGGHRRDMTVLFSDIRGFTAFTEKGHPEEVVGMLNEYFTRMVEIVFKHHGTLDKFVGDMVMALFGAPISDPSHADHAVAAALEMIEELNKLNRKWIGEGRAAGLDIGIGINSGPMIVGNIGSNAIMSYTVIGDAVNLASRLESLNKEYKTRIIISDATRRQLAGRYITKPLGEVVVKGKSHAVAIFQVLETEEARL